MPVPVTTFFPTLAAPGTPVPSVGHAETGAFLAALESVGASAGAKIDEAAQAGEGPPVAEQALPLSCRIAPQVAAVTVATQQVPAEPVVTPAPPAATETPVAPAEPVPPRAGTEAPAIPATASTPVATPPLPIASSPADPTSETAVDTSKAQAPATTPAEVMVVAAEPGLADPETLAPVTLAEATQAEEAAQPEAAIDAARPAKRKTTATASPAPSSASASASAPAPGTPVIAAMAPAPTTPADPAPTTAAPQPEGPRPAAPVAHAAPQAAEDTATPVSEARVSAPLFTQTLDAATTRHPAALPYDTARPAAAEASVTVREGRLGADVGVAIARALDGGPDGLRDALLIRLDPREMGRIDVRMGFDEDGTLRAVVSADQPAALDLLRRESTHLDRALSDAGVRADAQSLRFDTSANGGGGFGNGTGPHRPSTRPQGAAAEFTGAQEEAAPILRSLRGSGNLDLMA